ncbi:uncharacterized protein ISCGN_002295 [Ixodes scapularis]
MQGLMTGLMQPLGKGERLIITNIGIEYGFVAGCLDVFRCKKTGDYHDDMDGTRFEKWLDGVLQKVLVGSVVVMDNASYHFRWSDAVLTTKSRKEVIQEWLTSKGIAWDPNMPKKQLIDIVASVKPQHVRYLVDNVSAGRVAGCTVLRLPPYHFPFIPIERVWAQMKNDVAARNTTFKISDVKRLINEECAKGDQGEGSYVNNALWMLIGGVADDEFLRCRHGVRRDPAVNAASNDDCSSQNENVVSPTCDTSRISASPPRKRRPLVRGKAPRSDVVAFLDKRDTNERVLKERQLNLEERRLALEEKRLALDQRKFDEEAQGRAEERHLQAEEKRLLLEVLLKQVKKD